MNRVADDIALLHIGNMQSSLKYALQSGEVTLKDIKDTLQWVGLDIHLEDWFYDELQGDDD